ncbi:CobW family GTP-binding protein [Staphylococcus durrellii]|uniref:CobW family GTP-binding protein n=1 Tax=Staphylococcus durrellii TaxID=2781773 RepID=UPI0018A01F00|nr:GTP-binding protein [Staphylococcus durrellii]MBF7017692.1 GTP-binding protein [Staphylococcus durrellii]
MNYFKEQKLAVTIVTGFLGSGKTTFLNNYIQNLLKREENPQIVVNEVGNFDVNNQFSKEVPVIPMLNGCVCCDLKQDLLVQLKQVIAKNEYDHIVIEATGIAHPIEIIAACQDPEIIDEVAQPFIIGVVDATTFIDRERYTPQTKKLMEEQLSVCSLLLVNKMDLITEGEREKLTELNIINDKATIFYTTYGRVSNDQIRSVNQKDLQLEHSHGDHHNINSLNYTFTSAIDRRLFYQFILRLPENVLRLKGYVMFRDEPNVIYEFQYAHGMPNYQPVECDKNLTIVIIGEHLDVERIKNKLDMLQFT